MKIPTLLKQSSLIFFLVLVNCGKGSVNSNDSSSASGGSSGGSGSSGLTQLSVSDDFSSAATLGNWTPRSTLESSASDGSYSIVSGQMLLQPTFGEVWYDASRGLAVLKTFASATYPNMVIETQVHSYQTGTVLAPVDQFKGGGLVWLPDTSDTSDWVITAIGYTNGANALSFEYKTTSTNNSTLSYASNGSNYEGRVRICLVGSDIYAYGQNLSETSWTLIGSSVGVHTVGTNFAVGIFSNAWDNPGDASEVSTDSYFDYIYYSSEISSVSDCTKSF
ncbi:MAG: hypothetical protein CL678_07155 [Bdellovibrionaceae bacterium]|nr:hypothetical protein [Pseudobdellovibrionaceae bacterium]|tara:strand:+ start:758 stop:1591 length:834 start_codon:yes stop_codon:yes gene_type:complete